jgi:hypothetical protein
VLCSGFVLVVEAAMVMDLESVSPLVVMLSVVELALRSMKVMVVQRLLLWRLLRGMASKILNLQRLR